MDSNDKSAIKHIKMKNRLFLNIAVYDKHKIT
jgi:hypothetical protein